MSHLCIGYWPQWYSCKTGASIVIEARCPASQVQHWWCQLGETFQTTNRCHCVYSIGLVQPPVESFFQFFLSFHEPSPHFLYAFTNDKKAMTLSLRHFREVWRKGPAVAGALLRAHGGRLGLQARKPMEFPWKVNLLCFFFCVKMANDGWFACFFLTHGQLRVPNHES